MTSPFTRKLEGYVPLSTEDRAALEAIDARVEDVGRHQTLIREGDKPEALFLLLEGWAVRYKVLPNGKRQIVAFLLPGDVCDTRIFVLDRMDQEISMLSPGRVVRIRKDGMRRLIIERPVITRALLWVTLVDEAILREWLANIGGRDSFARLAHLLCELYVRLENVGLASGGECLIPLRQGDIAEALGLTAVHVNRVLRRFREEGLASLNGGHLVIHNIDAFKSVAGFSPDYLHGQGDLRAAEELARPIGRVVHTVSV